MTKDFPPVLIEHKGTITHRYEKLEDCGGSSSSCTSYYFILDNKKEHKVESATYMTSKVGSPVNLVLTRHNPESNFYDMIQALTLFLLIFGPLLFFITLFHLEVS